MAKASVTLTCPRCGKEYEWTAIKANRREADEWERWASSQTDRKCSLCFRHDQLNRRVNAISDAVAAAETQAHEFGFVELVGTEKQIKWAKQLRSNVFNRSSEKATPIYKSALVEAVNFHPDAAFWIDGRGILGFSETRVRREARGIAISKLSREDQEKLLAETRGDHLSHRWRSPHEYVEQGTPLHRTGGSRGSREVRGGVKSRFLPD